MKRRARIFSHCKALTQCNVMNHPKTSQHLSENLCACSKLIPSDLTMKTDLSQALTVHLAMFNMTGIFTTQLGICKGCDARNTASEYERRSKINSCCFEYNTFEIHIYDNNSDILISHTTSIHAASFLGCK